MPQHVGQQYVALKSIRAGGIEFSPDGYNGKYFAIKGKFKVTDEGTDAIESDGIAGACLFADLNPRLPIMLTHLLGTSSYNRSDIRSAFAQVNSPRLDIGAWGERSPVSDGFGGC
jgi:hypothetical protein